MIPVLGCAILNRPDLLYRMLGSIDVVVDRFVIVDNGGVADEIIAADQRSHSVTHIRPGHNLGVSASWNLVFKATPLASWWCIVGSDVELAQGDLARLVEHMNGVGGPAFAMMYEFNVFAINAEALVRVGLFDENFIPAYYEDNDMHYRLRLAGVPVAILPQRPIHDGSQTIRSDPHLGEENGRTFPENYAYYLSKWGGNPGSETLRSPFNRGGPVSEWGLDFDRLRRLTWR